MFPTAYTVAFFGHRHMERSVKAEKQLEEEIYRLMKEKRYVVFLTGRNGEFDLLVSSVITRLREQFRNDNSSLVLLLPYRSADYEKNREFYLNYYTEVEFCEAASAAYPKAAIMIRNREMADRADLVLCYVEKETGGAWKAVRYAKELGKEIINLAGDLS